MGESRKREWGVRNLYQNDKEEGQSTSVPWHIGNPSHGFRKGRFPWPRGQVYARVQVCEVHPRWKTLFSSFGFSQLSRSQKVVKRTLSIVQPGRRTSTMHLASTHSSDSGYSRVARKYHWTQGDNWVTAFARRCRAEAFVKWGGFTVENGNIVQVRFNFSKAECKDFEMISAEFCWTSDSNGLGILWQFYLRM